MSFVATSLAALIIEETKERIYEYALEIADGIGLPVTSWRPGDPSRSLLWLEAYTLEKLEGMIAGWIRSGFLDLAEDDWLVNLAEQQFGVIVPGATFATSTVVVTNNGGGEYPYEAFGLVFKNSTTNKLYRNTAPGTINPGPAETFSIAVEAIEEGSESSASADEIDEMVTTLLGVVVTSSTTAVGLDAQAPDVTRLQCRDKLGSLSPDGPREAYQFVARNTDLTGTRNVTRVRVFGDSDTGDVLVYLAGPGGAVEEADRLLVEAAIVRYAQPIGITPTVASATNVPIAVTYQLWVYQSVNKTSAQVQADVASALQRLFATREIGGDIIPPALTGSVYKSLIESTIRGVYADDDDRSSLVFRVTVAAPAGDTALTNSQVATLGAITPTITFVANP